MSMAAQILLAENLTVALTNGMPIIEDVSLELYAGEILGVVGESGSGKTTLALALLGYAQPGARITGGTMTVDTEVMTGRPEDVIRRLRGSRISYVPQDPGAALNPSRRVGSALRDVLDVHERAGGTNVVAGALGQMHLPSDIDFQRRFPHQLSGGQQQRVAIATATICKPPVVVFDEPTTGLDVITQARLIEELLRLREQEGIAGVYVSHDLAVVSSIADRIAVMYSGRIVEQGPTDAVLKTPRHPYTAGLIASIPDHLEPHRLEGIPAAGGPASKSASGCRFYPRCTQAVEACVASEPDLFEIAPTHQVRCIEWQRTRQRPRTAATPVTPETGDPILAVEHLRIVHKSRVADVIASDDTSFAVARGECVALVGESGSGKTTIARCIAGLHPQESGIVTLDGEQLPTAVKRRKRSQRQRIQIVFQNPYQTLNPRRPIGDQVARSAVILRGLSRGEAAKEAEELLERMRLPNRVGSRYPSQLSGGERQRVALARALVARPELLICDEVTSALDVSVQATILQLLAELRSELQLAMLFISHDLGVVATLATRVLVLQQGVLCEEGATSQVLVQPRAEYTQRLLAATPRLAQPAAAL